MANHLRAELVVDAIEMAVARRRPQPGLVHERCRDAGILWSAAASVASAARRQALDVQRSQRAAADRRRDQCAGASPGA